MNFTGCSYVLITSSSGSVIGRIILIVPLKLSMITVNLSFLLISLVTAAASLSSTLKGTSLQIMAKKPKIQVHGSLTSREMKMFLSKLLVFTHPLKVKIFITSSLTYAIPSSMTLRVNAGNVSVMSGFMIIRPVIISIIMTLVRLSQTLAGLMAIFVNISIMTMTDTPFSMTLIRLPMI